MPRLQDSRPPPVAILRGLEPQRAAEVGTLLFDAGFRIIEVPLNLPGPGRRGGALSPPPAAQGAHLKSAQPRTQNATRIPVLIERPGSGARSRTVWMALAL